MDAKGHILYPNLDDAPVNPPPYSPMMNQPTAPYMPVTDSRQGNYMPPNPNVPAPSGYNANDVQQPMAPLNVSSGGAQTVVIKPIGLTGRPQRMHCPHCNADIKTEVHYNSGRMTHIIAVVLCLLGCWCCCCVPYCVNGVKDADHKCPSCHHHIGTFKR